MYNANYICFNTKKKKKKNELINYHELPKKQCLKY